MTLSTRIGLSALLAGAWLPTAAMPAHAGWSMVGIPLGSNTRPAWEFSVAAGGSGDVFIGWPDRSGIVGALPTVYRLGSNGEQYPGWPPALSADPAAMYIDPDDVVNVLPDGNGGAFVAWSENGYAWPDGGVRVQHVLPNGQPDPAWIPGGIPITLPYAHHPRLIPDGAGGAFLCWSEYALGPLRVARVTGDGNVLGTIDPIGPTPAGPLTWFADILPDGSGGVMVAWGDTLNARLMRLTDVGEPSPGWPDTGIAIPTSRLDLSQPPRVLPAPGGDFLLVWKDRDLPYGPSSSIASPGRIFLQKLTPGGTIAPGWPASGVVAYSSTEDTSPLIAFADGYGGVMLAWSERAGTEEDLRLLRLNDEGNPRLGWSGAGLSAIESPAQFRGLTRFSNYRDLGFSATPDGSGGAFVAWDDDREVTGSSVRVTRVLSNGVLGPTWLGGGNDAAPAWAAPALLGLGSNGQGLVVAIWASSTATFAGEYATAIAPDGIVPVLVSLATAEVVPGGAKLAWVVTQLGAARVTIERRLGDAAWQPLATLAPDGTGRVAYEESGLAPGARVGYRLAYDDAGTPRTAGEVALVIPGHAAFGIAGVSPNPAGSEVTLRFALESGAPARLELYDAGGRRVRGAAVAAVPGTAATHRFDRLDLLPPGVYHARLSQGDRSDAVRLTVLR